MNVCKESTISFFKAIQEEQEKVFYFTNVTTAFAILNVQLIHSNFKTFPKFAGIIYRNCYCE
jgi:hypothetical protein